MGLLGNRQADRQPNGRTNGRADILIEALAIAPPNGVIAGVGGGGGGAV